MVHLFLVFGHGSNHHIAHHLCQPLLLLRLVSLAIGVVPFLFLPPVKAMFSIKVTIFVVCPRSGTTGFRDWRSGGLTSKNSGCRLLSASDDGFDFELIVRSRMNRWRWWFWDGRRWASVEDRWGSGTDRSDIELNSSGVFPILRATGENRDGSSFSDGGCVGFVIFVELNLFSFGPMTRQS